MAAGRRHSVNPGWPHRHLRAAARCTCHSHPAGCTRPPKRMLLLLLPLVEVDGQRAHNRTRASARKDVPYLSGRSARRRLTVPLQHRDGADNGMITGAHSLQRTAGNAVGAGMAASHTLTPRRRPSRMLHRLQILHPLTSITGSTMNNNNTIPHSGSRRKTPQRALQRCTSPRTSGIRRGSARTPGSPRCGEKLTPSP